MKNERTGLEKLLDYYEDTDCLTLKDIIGKARSLLAEEQESKPIIFPWMVDGPDWKDLIDLHDDAVKKFHAAKGKPIGSPELNAFFEARKKSSQEWLRIYDTPKIHTSKPVADEDGAKDIKISDCRYSQDFGCTSKYGPVDQVICKHSRPAQEENKERK